MIICSFYKHKLNFVALLQAPQQTFQPQPAQRTTITQHASSTISNAPNVKNVSVNTNVKSAPAISNTVNNSTVRQHEAFAAHAASQIKRAEPPPRPLPPPTASELLQVGLFKFFFLNSIISYLFKFVIKNKWQTKHWHLLLRSMILDLGPCSLLVRAKVHQKMDRPPCPVWPKWSLHSSQRRFVASDHETLPQLQQVLTQFWHSISIFYLYIV